MSLINDVRRICKRLALAGWGDLLAQHGLDIGAPDLARELRKRLKKIDRSAKGFEDFAIEGERGIEPGHPARSLLYHALASPNVLTGVDGFDLGDFPTLKEIDTVENYVFGVRPPSIKELHARAGKSALAIVVFAAEYRPGSQTCHRKHADLVFARTGVTRVGTARPFYDAPRRGFLPFIEGEPSTIRVCPARYSVYIAARVPGNKARFCPMRFEGRDRHRSFWQPLHKLFSGSECLRGFDNLKIELVAHHVNEKLRRMHRTLQRKKFDTGVNRQELDKAPFVFTKGIAEFSTRPADGPGLLVPVPHARLVESARFKGKPLSFIVPRRNKPLSSSFSVSGADDGPRHAPEYVHARIRVEADGKQTDLNSFPDVSGLVAAGGYRALHFIDFTADGWIEAACPQLCESGKRLSRPLAAYSLVTAPDFFPTCDQRELKEWSATLPQSFRDHIWDQEPPNTLSDQRLAANLQLPQSPFDKDDKTMTAIVSMFGEVSGQQTNIMGADAMRHSPLPDDSAGIFAPGWDVSRDRFAGTQHFAAYGLGSPFPEDAKLCAALSTFWPAAAPDATRTMEPELTPITVSPLTDEEIGEAGRLPWDGIRGPRVIQTPSGAVAEFASLAHADYVQSALKGKFSLLLTSHIGAEEYQDRVIAMEVAYRALRTRKLRKKSHWLVLSFRRVTPGIEELVQAQRESRTTLPAKTYRFEIFRNGTFTPSRSDVRKTRIRIKDLRILFVSPNRNNPTNSRVLMKKENHKFVKAYPRRGED